MHTFVHLYIYPYIHTYYACSLFTGFESMLWMVPNTIATKGNPQAAQLLLSQWSTNVNLEGVREGDWVLLSPRVHVMCLSVYMN